VPAREIPGFGGTIEDLETTPTRYVHICCRVRVRLLDCSGGLAVYFKPRQAALHLGMKRWLFNLAAALSLLLSLAASAAWATSYVRPPGWRLIGIAHSADLTPVNRGRSTALFTTAANWSKAEHHGFWDALWALSESGRLTLLAQAVDYEGTVGRVHASPPSLIVDLRAHARPQAVVFRRMPDAGPWARRLGFAWHSDAQLVDDGDGAGGRVSARARIVTLPYWFIVLLGLAMPLLWVQVTRRRRDTSVP
jgi:hypothetical protein